MDSESRSDFNKRRLLKKEHEIYFKINFRMAFFGIGGHFSQDYS